MTAPKIVELIEDQEQAYSGDEERPLRGYIGLLGTYSVYAGGLFVAARLRMKRGGSIPESVSAADLALISVATHKLSRLMSKDPVTAPFRAAFTRFKGQSGPGEVAEETRGTGIQHAVGELLTCPFCLGQWTATGFVAGLVFAPRATRLVASTFAAVTASDFLQLGYAASQQLCEIAGASNDGGAEG